MFPVPPLLERLSSEIDRATTQDECWSVLVTMLEKLGLDHAIFVYQHPIDGAHVETRCRTGSNRNLNLQLGSPLLSLPVGPKRLHSWKAEQICFFGASFFGNPEFEHPFTPGEVERLYNHAAKGWRSAVMFPFGMCPRDGYAQVFFTTAAEKSYLMHLVENDGWLLHVLSKKFKTAFLNCARKEAVGKLGLTDRQRKFIPLLAKGMPRKQIAHLTGVSEQAVSKMIRNIEARFSVQTPVGVVARAAKLGMLDHVDLAERISTPVVPKS